VSGQIFIAGGTGKTLTAVGPGTNGVFDNLPIDGGDDVAGPHIDLSTFVTNAEGLGYRASSDTLLLTDAANDAMYEITKDGRLIREIDISELKLPNIPLTPSDVALAPPSDGSPGLNVYMTDRVKDNEAEPTPPRDGKMYELSVPFENLAPWVDAGSNHSIAISDPLSITGDTYDDGQPNPVAPTVTWSKVSGPGTVTFASPNSLTTTVSFSAIGGSANPYVLKLTSTDGLLSSEDTMQVQVFADPPVNQPPTVFAGSNQTITLPSVANLSGVVGDDGLPNPPGAVSTTWTKVSGPGTVTFANAASIATTASFSKAGSYVLRLTANDGALQSSDELTVTVNGERVVVVGDFTGSSRDDIAVFDDAAGTWSVFASTGSSFTESVWADFATTSGWEAHVVGDFNGDGLDDIGNFKDGRWWISRSTGNTFTTSRWTDFSTRSGWQAHLVGDFNGDGLDDIGNFKDGRWWISRSTGNTFTTSRW
jgi:hypothetical protein